MIVVDDGLDWRGPGVLRGASELEAFCTGPRVSIIPGISPFVFSRNVNLGIKAAGDDDVIVLGDDGLLETPGGFTALWDCAKQHPDFGIISDEWLSSGGNIRQHLQPGHSDWRRPP